MRTLGTSFFWLGLLIGSCSQSDTDSLCHRIKEVKRDTTGKTVSYFFDGSIQYIIDNLGDSMFIGSRYEFSNSGLKKYSFQTDEMNATYIEHFGENGQVSLTEGNPIVYSFTSADEAKDSMYVKRYVSTFCYKDVQVEVAGPDKIFTKVKLGNEPNMSFIKSFHNLINVKNEDRFIFITKFSGRRIDDNSLKTYYDTTDYTKR